MFYEYGNFGINDGPTSLQEILDERVVVAHLCVAHLDVVIESCCSWVVQSKDIDKSLYTFSWIGALDATIVRAFCVEQRYAVAGT